MEVNNGLLLIYGLAYGHGYLVTLPISYSNARSYSVTTSAIATGWALLPHEYNIIDNTASNFKIRMLENNRTSSTMNAYYISIGF